ncbi:MAG: SGNH/GDSL hydrolase family protein [Siphonobacter aquaeclarae]|nr:SGNH/GDSL hydrolase family protein [Siphonobacter aquaeclarae]
MIRFCLFLFLGLGICTAVQAQSDSLAYARYFRVRQGLPHFFSRLKAGQPVRIAYLGGSITEAGGGWRDQSADWFRQQYPKATVSQIAAGIGGTGSDLGVFRLQSQVLDQHPDLVFVEFAVNDNGKKPEQIHRAMEGIVRKIRKNNSHTDICFVYTLTGDMAPILREGRLPVSAASMEQIAEHYGIPTVHMGLRVVALAGEGKLIFKGKKEDYPDKIVFSPDNVHPYAETGHKFYTEALADAMKVLAQKDAGKSRRLPKPYRKDNWENARMIPATELVREGNWQVLTPETDPVAKQLRSRFPVVLKASEPGAALVIRYKGAVCGLYDVIGSGCGQYTVTAEGSPDTLIPRFDGFATYYRSHYFFFPDSSGKGTHTLRLQVAAQGPDKTAILSTRGAKMDDPARFRENACYAGYLLVVGKLVK